MSTRWQCLDALCLISFNALFQKDELEDRGVFLRAVDLVLNVEHADFVLGREVLDFTIVCDQKDVHQ